MKGLVPDIIRLLFFIACGLPLSVKRTSPVGTILRHQI